MLYGFMNPKTLILFISSYSKVSMRDLVLYGTMQLAIPPCIVLYIFNFLRFGTFVGKMTSPNLR